MNWIVFPNQKFTLGQVVATPGALDLAKKLGINFLALLLRHAQGDWGDMCSEDVEVNNLSLANGARLFSCYKNGVENIWIITEWDRSSTTILLPDEY